MVCKEGYQEVVQGAVPCNTIDLPQSVGAAAHSRNLLCWVPKGFNFKKPTTACLQGNNFE
jgi:hypothetical protein